MKKTYYSIGYIIGTSVVPSSVSIEEYDSIDALIHKNIFSINKGYEFVILKYEKGDFGMNDKLLKSITIKEALRTFKLGQL